MLLMNNVLPNNQYPSWLGKWLLGDIKQPYPEGQKISIQKFCEIYPIADSTFIYMGSPNLGASTEVIVRWFTRAIEDRLPYSSTYYLYISFDNAFGVFFDGPNTLTNTIQSFKTSILSDDELKNRFDFITQKEQTYWQTAIVDIVNNRTFIVHTDEVYIICFNADGDSILLPELE